MWDGMCIMSEVPSENSVHRPSCSLVCFLRCVLLCVDGLREYKVVCNGYGVCGVVVELSYNVAGFT